MVPCSANARAISGKISHIRLLKLYLCFIFGILRLRTRPPFENGGIHLFKVNVDIREGDLFEPIKKGEKFDFIFWNHPFNYINRKIKDVLLMAGFDSKYNDLKRFFAEGKNFLKPGGSILLGTGSIAYLDEIGKIAKSNGYEQKLIKVKKSMISKSVTGTDIRVYEFKPKD
ncbi:MAG: hypothetical protein ABIJ92_03815 [Candidatus Aenigmatarchaeota archaeon]